MASMQICYRDPRTKQYVCETTNVYSAAVAQEAQPDSTTDGKPKKPKKAEVELKANELMTTFLQADPDDFTITYLAADD
jgi:hypothetical protein